MLIFSAFASFSILSIVGEYVSFAILLIVDLDIPVITDNWRTDIFFLYMISPSRIFMIIFYSAIALKSMEIATIFCSNDLSRQMVYNVIIIYTKEEAT